MNEAREQLLGWIPQFVGRRVLVIGDLFLDDYLFGQATRLSREAPIPVLEFERRILVPGGAANPAHNICALGGQATIVGVIGQDGAGQQLLEELSRVGIEHASVVVDDSRNTTTKLRVMAEAPLRFPQQLARIDHLDHRPLSDEVEDELVAQVQRLAPTADAVLVSDYRAGVASEKVVKAALGRARDQGKLCTVDAQGSFHKYAGFDLVKGNRGEFEAALGRPLQDEIDYSSGGQKLLEDLGARILLITRGADGISVVTQDQEYWHLPAANRSEVFDVTGAGDTVIAIATLALLAGASAREAACLANYGAGWVIRRLGNAVVTADQLASAVEQW